MAAEFADSMPVIGLCARMPARAVTGASRMRHGEDGKQSVDPDDRLPEDCDASH
jgi:hypothetical protein